MVTAKEFTKTSQKQPYLWVSNAVVAQPLKIGFEEIYSPDVPPSQLEKGKHHILAFDADTPEKTWKEIAYMLQSAGCEITVRELGRYSNVQPLEWWLKECPINEVIIDISSNHISYSAWEESFAKEPLSIKEALELAELVLRHLGEGEKANIALEELRRRANVSEYNWDKKYLEPIRKRLERQFALPEVNQLSEPLDPSERKRLELKAIAQERDPYKFTDKLIEFCRRTGWSRRDVEQQIRLLKTSTITPKAKRLKGKDFLGLETESISWVFPGIIPSRGVFVVGGDAGSGKSTLAYDAAGSLLLGEEFLGEKPVKTGKVLIVTGDELPCFTQDKLIDRGIPLDNEEWEIILNWDVSQWDVLEEAIADIRPALVIIDSFSSIHRDPSFDENSSQAKSTIYDLEALTNAYNCGCILIHHVSKSKENKGVAKLRGSSAISAAASVVCIMEKTSDGNSRILSFPKVRGAQTEPFVIHLDGSTGRYQVDTGGDDNRTKSLGERILEFLQKSPYTRFEQEEISEALHIPSVNKDSVYQALGRLFKRGLITKRPSKMGGKRKVYGLVNPQSRCDNTIGDTSSRNVTDTLPDIFPDTHPPSPPNVSVQISKSIDTHELKITDSLTDSLTDTELTLLLESTSVSIYDDATVGITDDLTDTCPQEGVSPAVSDPSTATGTYPYYDLWDEEAIAEATETIQFQLEHDAIVDWQEVINMINAYEFNDSQKREVKRRLEAWNPAMVRDTYERTKRIEVSSPHLPLERKPKLGDRIRLKANRDYRGVINATAPNGTFGIQFDLASSNLAKKLKEELEEKFYEPENFELID